MLWFILGIIILGGMALCVVLYLHDKKSIFACVNCGKSATEGSMMHPYCKKCFQKVWHGDYQKYQNFLDTEHFKKKGKNA